MKSLYDDVPDLTLTPADGGFVLVSKSTGMRIEIVEMDGRDRFRLQGPAFAGEPAVAIETDDWSSMLAIYGERWLRWVTVTIGLGFHPDTRADDYVPALPDALRSVYDPMIDFVFERVPDDPYAIGLDAWEKGGLLNDPPSPVP